MKIELTITFQNHGVHRYPEAERKDIREDHLHMFGFSVQFEVSHLDREIEWLDLRDKLRQALAQKFGRLMQFGTRSCEEIAVEVAKLLPMFLSPRQVRVAVGELDEACAAAVTFSKEEMEEFKKALEKQWEEMIV